MALKLITHIQCWIGTAAERAAMVTTAVTVGSTFEETDTGLTYKWSGAAWFISTDENVAATMADGANVTLGAKADAKSTATDSTAVTIMQVLKEISYMAQTPAQVTKKSTATVPAAAPVTVAVTAGGTVIAAANANRLSVTLQNTGSEPCIVRLGGDPSTAAYNLVLAEDTGTRFGGGGSVTIDDYTGAIKGITEANTTVIAVTEVVTA